MRPTYPVLIVSERPEVVDEIAAWLDGHLVDAVADASEASRIVEALPLAALIIDVGGVPREATGVLVRRFTARQPAGRVAILAAPDDMSTLVASTFSDQRVEMFFAPWDGNAVTAFLQLADVAATTST